MKILLVNDDGIFAPGIVTMGRALEAKGHQVTMVGPNIERSGQSHAITLFREMRLLKVNIQGFSGEAYSLEGTPADCVRVALDYKLVDEVDLVISGINLGYNAGMDILYSGTVSAAIEANVYGIASIAVSAEWKDGTAAFETAAAVALEVLEKTKNRLTFRDKPILLNLNVPYMESIEGLKGIEVCPVGDVIHDRYEGRKTEYYHGVTLIGRHPRELSEQNDRHYLAEGYATLTPLIYDLTNHDLLETVKEWI